MARDGSTLRCDIPQLAREFFVYTGPYSDFRREDAVHKLFHDESLQGLFDLLDSLQTPYDVWAYFLDGVVSAIECVPEATYATSERPDTKINIRKKQTKADILMLDISKKARELASKLFELDGLRADTPSETYSSKALIQLAMDQQKSAAKDDFGRFVRLGLSSYQRSDIPPPWHLLEALAKSIDAYPKASQIFNDDPWLGSNKSSWADFIRIVADILNNIYLMHRHAIEIPEKIWIQMVKILIDGNIGRSSVNRALRDLPPFLWDAPKK